METIGLESYHIEMNCMNLQILENVNMYNNGIFEMVNFKPEDSNLPYEIWFDEIGHLRKNKHTEPRVKIKLNNENLIPVLIDKKPKILLKGTQLKKAEKEFHGSDKKIMFQFISKHHELMLKHWYGKISTLTLLTTLQGE